MKEKRVAAVAESKFGRAVSLGAAGHPPPSASSCGLFEAETSQCLDAPSQWGPNRGSGNPGPSARVSLGGKSSSREKIQLTASLAFHVLAVGGFVLTVYSCASSLYQQSNWSMSVKITAKRGLEREPALLQMKKQHLF